MNKAGYDFVFENHKITEKPQPSLYLEWDELADLFTDLLTGLLGRNIEAGSKREEFYYWNISLETPLTQEELEVVFESAAADELDLEQNMYEEGCPIYELTQGICSKLISKLLPFNLIACRADDEGVRFIGESDK